MFNVTLPTLLYTPAAAHIFQIETVAFFQCQCIDPDNLGEPTGCVSPAYKGDGNCDDGNNNEGCEYDGGDCCAATAKNGKVKTAYCKKVSW